MSRIASLRFLDFISIVILLWSLLFFLFLYLNTLRQMFVFHVRMDICEYRYKLYLTLSVPNFRQQLSSAFVFSLLTNYRLERSIYATLKDWISNSVDPDKMAHYELSHLDLCCLQKPIIIACGSERVKVQTFIACVYIYIYIRVTNHFIPVNIYATLYTWNVFTKYNFLCSQERNHKCILLAFQFFKLCSCV